MPTATTSLQHSIQSPSHSNQTRRKYKHNQIRRERYNCHSIHADNMILMIEKSKHSTQKLLDLTNTVSKVAGYKISIQKSAAFYYTNNGILEGNVKQTKLHTRVHTHTHTHTHKYHRNKPDQEGERLLC